MGSSEAGLRGTGVICGLWVGLLGSLVCVACSEDAMPYPTRSLSLARDAAVDSGRELLQLDGEPCNEDAVCDSGHCSNRVCCVSGECCRDELDCSANDRPGMCMNPSSCSGMKPVATCDDNQCKVEMGEDDTACDSTVQASDCELFKPVFCTGKAKQSRPQCPMSCDSDDACDPGAHCERGDCVSNAESGTPCQSASECQTGRCISGFCCDSDNCCAMDSDCDQDEYGKALACDDEAACQGSSGVAVCQNGRCGTKRMEDDSACSASVVANECEGGAKVYCRGGREQTSPPGCPSGSCSRDLDCVRSAYCAPGASLFASGACTPDLPNGGPCDRGEVCQSGHCSDSGDLGSSGVCCSYDCCDATARCPDLDCSMMMEACGN